VKNRKEKKKGKEKCLQLATSEQNLMEYVG
jgi:hypothetical protein